MVKERKILTVAFLFQVFDRDEAHGCRVHAIAESGGCGAVVEDMAQMGVGVFRADLGARQDQICFANLTKSVKYYIICKI